MTEPSEIIETQTYERSSRRYNSAYRIRTKTISPDLQKYKMRTLNKQIKENNVDKILGEAELNWAGQREDLVVAEAEKNEIVNNITMLRKKLDETRDQYNKKELEMARMKDEIDKMKGDEGYFNDHTYKSRWRVEQLKNALEMQKLKLEEAHISKKTYEGMLERMRKDNLVDKVKTTKLEKSLSVKTRALSSEAKSTRKAYQMRAQTTNVFSEILKRVETEDRKRQENLFLFERAVISKEIAEKGRAERIKRTENLQDIVAKEMSFNGEKQYRNLYLVHKFVHLFYKKQMDDEMRKNAKIELAFQRIRASVGITDAQQLVEKFVKREETYSELLTSISNHEKQVEEAKVKKEKLQARAAALREKRASIQKQKGERKTSDPQESQMYKIFSKQSETYKEANFKLERSHLWALKTLQILEKARNVEEPTNYAELFPKGMAVPAILKVIQSIKEELRFIETEDYVNILDDIEGTDMNPEITKKEFLLKNTRVNQDEMVSEGRRSASSSRSPSRVTTTLWEERNERNSLSKSSLQIDDEAENALNARRREIKHKQNQADILKKIREEKLKEEEEGKYRR